MLTVTYTRPGRSMAEEDGIIREKVWKVGDDPLSEQLDDAGLSVISIYADGEELSYIDNLFKNLPITPYRNKTCVWRGEFARFIFDNL